MSRDPHLGVSERRVKERINVPFPATVEGTDDTGEAFKIETVLDNLSAEGMYLRLVPCVIVGSSLSVVFRLSNNSDPESKASRVAIRGVVLRAEEKEGGACGVAVKFNGARFI